MRMHCARNVRVHTKSKWCVTGDQSLWHALRPFCVYLQTYGVAAAKTTFGTVVNGVPGVFRGSSLCYRCEEWVGLKQRGEKTAWAPHTFVSRPFWNLHITVTTHIWRESHWILEIVNFVESFRLELSPLWHFVHDWTFKLFYWKIANSLSAI